VRGLRLADDGLDGAGARKSSIWRRSSGPELGRADVAEILGEGVLEVAVAGAVAEQGASASTSAPRWTRYISVIAAARALRIAADRLARLARAP
jgi:hypothetical protein